MNSKCSVHVCIVIMPAHAVFQVAYLLLAVGVFRFSKWDRFCAKGPSAYIIKFPLRAIEMR